MHWFNLSKRKRPLRRAAQRLHSCCLPIAEELEDRRLFTTFTATIAAPPTWKAGQNTTVQLVTTGGVSASSQGWSITWGDNTGTTTVDNSSGTQQVQANHTYANTGDYTITATCTPQGGGSSVTATYALSTALGNWPDSTKPSGRTIQTPDSDTGSGTGYAMAIDDCSMLSNPNYGKMYVASAYNGQFAVTRFNTNGTPDSNFGRNGTINFAVDASTDTALAIALHRQSTSDNFDDEIALAGSGQGGFAVALVAYTNGSWSTAWTKSNIQSGQANGVAFDQGANVLAVGVNTGANHSMEAVDLNYTDGSLNTSWGTNSSGKLAISFSGSSASSANAVILDSNIGTLGDMVVGGWASYCACGASYQDFALAALNSSGGLDTSFNLTGKVVENFGTLNSSTASTDDAYGLIKAGTGVLAAGSTNYGGTTKFGYQQFTSTGALDSGFNSHGWQTGTNGIAYGVTTDSNSNIVAAGATSSDFVIQRLTSSGSPDNGFGNNSVFVPVDFGTTSANSNDQAASVIVEPTDVGGTAAKMIVACGWTGGTGSSGQIALAGYVPTNKAHVTTTGTAPLAAQAVLSPALTPAVPSATTALAPHKHRSSFSQVRISGP